MRAQLDVHEEAAEREAGAAADRVAHPSANGVDVRHYVSGGLENGGGIGRLVGYIVGGAPAGARHRVTDTRGPRWFPPTSIFRLLGAIAVMAKDRATAPRLIHHIHVAGRGSTSRKLILAGAARFLGCRHILHLHDYDYAADYQARAPRRRAAVRQMFQGADHVIALGRRDRQTLETQLAVSRRRLSVLHNCVPDPGRHERPSAGEGGIPTIVFLGRLSERKGVPELLRALAHPVMAGLAWRAVLAGDGPVDEYRGDAADLGLSDRVEMPGWLDGAATRALSARADILVLPSHAEGMAMAVIEGLAHGLAIVTTRVGAHEEAITDGENGLFVPVGDAEALAEALARLVSDGALRARLGVHARGGYLARFSMPSYLRRLSGIYQIVSNSHPNSHE